MRRKFPSTLSYRSKSGSIPIQHAAGSNDVFEYTRGGLLMVDSSDDDGWNTLQWFVNVGDDDEFADVKIVI